MSSAAPLTTQMPLADKGLPHGLEPIIIYPEEWSLSFYLLLFFLITLLLGLAYFFYRRKSKRPKKEINLPLKIYTETAVLVPDEPFLKKQQEDYFYQLSFNLRHYIELRRDISATDLTFQELKKPLEQKLHLAEKSIQEILFFLKEADSIKFAKKTVELQEALNLQQKVLAWMKQLDPVNPEDQGKEKGVESL